MPLDKCDNNRGQKYRARESGKEVKIQEFLYRDKTNVEPGCKIVSVIIGATGIVTKGLRKNLEAIPGTQSIDSVQKTAVLGTSHITRKVL